MGLPSRHIGCSSWSRSIHLLLLLFLCEALALSSSALEEVQGEQEEAATTTTRAETATVQGASASRAHHNYGVVVKKREEACVVGGGEGEGDGDAFRARYCVELYLKDVGARRNHLHSLRWLRLEHVNLLLPVKLLPSLSVSVSVCVSLSLFVGLPQDQELAFCLGLCFSSLRKGLVGCQFFFLPFFGRDGEKLLEMR
jgi:hypothetical protein